MLVCKAERGSGGVESGDAASGAEPREGGVRVVGNAEDLPLVVGELDGLAKGGEDGVGRGAEAEARRGTARIRSTPATP
jgi:hypothetical protein